MSFRRKTFSFHVKIPTGSLPSRIPALLVHAIFSHLIVEPRHTGQMGTPSAPYYTAKYSIIFHHHCLFRHILSLQNKPRHFHNSLNLVYYPRSLLEGVYRRKPTLSLHGTQFHALLEKGHAK